MSCLLCYNLDPSTGDAPKRVHTEDTEENTGANRPLSQLICLSAHQLCVKQYSPDNNSSGVESLALICWLLCFSRLDAAGTRGETAMAPGPAQLFPVYFHCGTPDKSFHIHRQGGETPIQFIRWWSRAVDLFFLFF